MIKAKIISEILAHLNEQTGDETDLERLKMMFRFLPTRDYVDPEDVVIPTALVRLECQGRESLCYIVPSGGGMILSVDGMPVQVVTPHSPLGEAMIGRKRGDQFDMVPQSGKARTYKIVGLT
jgi:transcription elongation GreA/GreB family factor